MVMLDDSILSRDAGRPSSSSDCGSDSDSEQCDALKTNETLSTESAASDISKRIETIRRQRGLEIACNTAVQSERRTKRNKLFMPDINSEDSDSDSSTETYVTAPTGKSTKGSPEPRTRRSVIS